MPDRTAVRNGLLATIAVLLITAGLRESYSVSMPLAVAALLITAIWPVKTWLDRVLPSTVSYAATVLALLFLLAAFVSAVYFSAAQIVGAFAQNWSKLDTSYRSLTAWADKWGIVLGGQQGYDRVIGFAQDLLANAYTIIAYLGFIAILVVLGLPEIEFLKRKIGEEFSKKFRIEIIGVIDEIGNKVRLYLGITTLTSFLTGVATGLWTIVFGLDLALVWGILTSAELHSRCREFNRNYSAQRICIDAVSELDDADRHLCGTSRYSDRDQQFRLSNASGAKFVAFSGSYRSDSGILELDLGSCGSIDRGASHRSTHRHPRTI